MTYLSESLVVENRLCYWAERIHMQWKGNPVLLDFSWELYTGFSPLPCSPVSLLLFCSLNAMFRERQPTYGSLHILLCFENMSRIIIFYLHVMFSLHFLHTWCIISLKPSYKSGWEEVPVWTPWCMQVISLNSHFPLKAQRFISEDFYLSPGSMQALVHCSLNVSWEERGRERN